MLEYRGGEGRGHLTCFLQTVRLCPMCCCRDTSELTAGHRSLSLLAAGQPSPGPPLLQAAVDNSLWQGKWNKRALQISPQIFFIFILSDLPDNEFPFIDESWYFHLVSFQVSDMSRLWYKHKRVITNLLCLYLGSVVKLDYDYINASSWDFCKQSRITPIVLSLSSSPPDVKS